MDQNLIITPLIAEAIILINASKQTRAVVLLYFSPLDPIMQNWLQNLRFCLEITETSFSSFRPLGAWHPFPLSFIFDFICKVVRNYGCFLIKLLRATSPSASAAGWAHLWGAVLSYKWIIQTFTSDALLVPVVLLVYMETHNTGEVQLTPTCFPGIFLPHRFDNFSRTKHFFGHFTKPQCVQWQFIF